MDNSAVSLSRARSVAAQVGPRLSQLPSERWGCTFSRMDLTRMSEAAIALGPGEEIVYFNPAAEALYGLKARAVIGRRFGDVIASSSSGVTAELMEGAGTHFVRGRGRGRARESEGVAVWVSLIQHTRKGADANRLAIIRDNSDYQKAAAAQEERIAFEMMISDLSARFSSIPLDEIDLEIERSLGRMGEFLKVDRGTFSELTSSGNIVITHAFARPGIQLTPKGPANERLPWLVQQLSAGHIVKLSSIPDDLPPQAKAEREVFGSIGMTAGIGIPIAIGESLACVLTFGVFGGSHAWPPALVSRLRLVGEVFGNAIFRRQARLRLHQKQQELAHFGRVAVLGELAAVIAHELDQPLTAVVSNAQAVRSMLEDPAPDLAEVDDALSDIIDAALRVSAITQRERTLLRKSEMSFARVNLNDVIREIEQFLRAEARHQGGTLDLELMADLPMIMADRIQLQQVIFNLARNALQAMAGQPRETCQVRIRTIERYGEVLLTVSDNGPPVDDACITQMFQPFYTTKSNGLGMGLSISKSIIESHRGHISAIRNPPRARAHAHAHAHAHAGDRVGKGGLTIQIAIPQIEVHHVSGQPDRPGSR